MPEVSYDPAPTYSSDEYEQARKALASGAIPSDKQEHVRSRVAEFEKSQAFDAQARYHTSPQLDPAKEELVKKVKNATRDDTLKSASRLKVFGGQTEYPGRQKPVNPFSALGSGLGAQAAELPTSHTWKEPSVKDFRAALAEGGSLAEQAKKELGKGAYGPATDPFGNELINVGGPGPNEHAAPKTKDITQLGNKPADPALMDDAALGNTDAFLAYRDAAWNHALADAIAQGKPIYRLEYTDKLSPEEKMIAKAQDVGGAVLGGAGQSATLGQLDPLKRAINPKLAAADRQQRNRSPKAEMVGELGGAFVGAPEVIARGSAKILGSALGDTALGRLGASAGAGAITGGVDAQSRSIAQAAADALDAGDSAQEMASRIYDALSGGALLAGAGMGAGAGAAGHAVGSVLGGGARKIVGGAPRDMLLNAEASGVKMGSLGEPVLPKDLADMAAGAASRRATAEAEIAADVAPRLLTQRLKEHEEAAARALGETSAARAKLGEATVDMKPLSERIEAYAKEMPGMTPEAAAKKTAIRRYARRIRNEGQATAKRVDEVMAEIDSQANQSGKDPDKDWNNVSALARDARDEFQYDTPTRVDNYAIRSPTGENKVVSDYSGMKTRQSNEMSRMAFDDARMGIPENLQAAPVRVGPAGPEETARFFESHPNLPKIQEYFNSERAVASDVERSNFTRPKQANRTAEATQAQYAANKSLTEAVNKGLGYQGTTYRGVRMSPEEVQNIISSGKVKSDHLWSTSKDEGHALSFAKKQGAGEPVLLEISGSSGVDLDGVPGLEVFDEVAVPTGRQFKVTDSFRDKDGILRVKISDGTRGPQGDEALALAEGAEPQARVQGKDYKAFENNILGTADPKNAIVSEKILSLAKRSGLNDEKAVRDIQRLRDAQNWKQYLGRAISGVGSGGGVYLKMNNLIRAVPSLKSLSGGLPRMEATDQAVDLVDRFLENSVPSWKPANLRGGQPAKIVGAVSRNEKGDDAKLTPEESAVAKAVIRQLLKLQEGN